MNCTRCGKYMTNEHRTFTCLECWTALNGLNPDALGFKEYKKGFINDHEDNRLYRKD